MEMCCFDFIQQSLPQHSAEDIFDSVASNFQLSRSQYDAVWKMVDLILQNSRPISGAGQLKVAVALHCILVSGAIDGETQNCHQLHLAAAVFNSFGCLINESIGQDIRKSEFCESTESDLIRQDLGFGQTLGLYSPSSSG